MAKKEKSEAAEKVEQASKIKKARKPKSDKPFILVRMGKAIARFCKDFKGETKKIVWPTGKTVLKSSCVVLAVVLVIGAGIWIADFALSKSIDLLSVAATSYNERQAAATDTDDSTPTDDETTTVAESVAASDTDTAE